MSPTTDSTNCTTGEPCFEGPEKTLRVYFDDSANLLEHGERAWQQVLDTVRCKILSSEKSETAHTYLLSESSLIVYKTSVMLKTCGTTTLIYGLPHILALAGEPPGAVVYSRRSYFFPQKQCHPHGCWPHEVELLRRMFPNGGTSTATFGQDCKWHLFAYVAQRAQRPNACAPYLELMMSGLSADACQRFSVRSDSMSVVSLESTCDVELDGKERLGVEMTRHAGIDRIFGVAQAIDAHAFDPCGYSCNALVASAYFTVHVTPERASSYASFETNAPLAAEDAAAVFARVLRIFRPQNVMVAACNTAMPDLAGYECVTEGTFASGQVDLTHRNFRAVNVHTYE